MSFTTGTNTNPYLLQCNLAGYIRVDLLTFKNNTVVDKYFICATNGPMISIGEIFTLPPLFVLTNAPINNSADHTIVDTWARREFSQDIGDADYIAPLGGPTIIMANTPLTAARTITIPAINDVFSGLTYRVIRTALATGAFSLNVALQTVPIGGWIELTANHAQTTPLSTWILTGNGTL